MKALSLNEMELIQGGIFWGTAPVVDCDVYYAGIGDSCLVCNQTYYFWIPAGSPTNCHWVRAEYAYE